MQFVNLASNDDKVSRHDISSPDNHPHYPVLTIARRYGLSMARAALICELARIGGVR